MKGSKAKLQYTEKSSLVINSYTKKTVVTIKLSLLFADRFRFLTMSAGDLLNIQSPTLCRSFYPKLNKVRIRSIQVLED